MKLFVILTEHDGETTKKPGETSTKIVRRERRYAAMTIEEVWKHHWNSPEFLDEGEELKAIYEEQPSVTVLSK